MLNRYFTGITLALLSVAGFGVQVHGADATEVTNLPPVIQYLSPEDEAKTFFLQDGYRMELVLSDPIIKEPVLTAFDGNGRMFVAEMRSYMQDIDGHNEHAHNGRVSLHWSSKGNGVYDKHTVFVDNLCLPRMVLPMDGGVLINESDSDDYWLYRDTKGNGVADSKTLFYGGGPRGGNIEHQPGGLIYDLDNWLYMPVNAYRLRPQSGKVLREPTGSNMGQWGMTQDDFGKPWFVNAGLEAGPITFQQPIAYGAFHYGDEMYENNYHTVWPLIGLADVQGGTVRFRPVEKSLNHFTASCGQEIYRGDKLPGELRGDLFMAEPVGRLVRRTKIEVRTGITYLRNAYDKTEFIRSTDPDFRPVNTANAPDGTLYITDMYRGIIQEKDWVNPGSYLRGVVQQYNMQENIGRGRIWRVVYKGMKPGPQPHMLDEKPEQLVPHLASPNGWWRDTAQKILVLRGDKSVAPAVKQLAQPGTNYLARLHALWTLEGLDSLDASLVLQTLKDPNPDLRRTAVRLSESIFHKGDQSLLPVLAALANDPDPNVVIQLMLSANLARWPGWDDMIRNAMAANQTDGVAKVGSQIAPPAAPAPVPAPAPVLTPVSAPVPFTRPPVIVSAPPPIPVAPALPPPVPSFTDDELGLLQRGELGYKQLCFACHALDGKGTPLAPGRTTAPPLGGSATASGYRDGVIRVLLKGLSGPVDGKKYDAQMVPMESYNDDWIASVLSYVRNNFGNHSTFITSNDVARVRATLTGRSNTWTIQELHDTLPQPLTNRSEWKITASVNSPGARFAVDDSLATRYSTLESQVPGMWVQVELPEETQIVGVEINSGTSTNEYPRGYKIELSGDGDKWLLAQVTDHSTALRNQILFPSAPAKFVRITLTAADPHHNWAIHDLEILKAASASATTSTAQNGSNTPAKPSSNYE